MDAALHGDVRQVEAAQHVAADRLHLARAWAGARRMLSGERSLPLLARLLGCARCGTSTQHRSPRRLLRCMALHGDRAAVWAPHLVILTPVDIGPAGHARRVEHVCRLHLRLRPNTQWRGCRMPPLGEQPRGACWACSRVWTGRTRASARAVGRASHGHACLPLPHAACRHACAGRTCAAPCTCTLPLRCAKDAPCRSQTRWRRGPPGARLRTQSWRPAA